MTAACLIHTDGQMQISVIFYYLKGFFLRNNTQKTKKKTTFNTLRYLILELSGHHGNYPHEATFTHCPTTDCCHSNSWDNANSF